MQLYEFLDYAASVLVTIGCVLRKENTLPEATPYVQTHCPNILHRFWLMSVPSTP